MNHQAILGLDVGGANLKVAAPASGQARSEPFALWKEPRQLEHRLAALVERLPACPIWALTMTGELCDCFPNKQAGVRHIVDAVEAVATRRRARVIVWTTQSRFLSPEAIRQQPLVAAAANWLALARFVGRFAPHGLALLLDIGSTTTDIIPLLDGQPVPLGLDDPSRLAYGELVYTGVRRTPLCALLGSGGAAEFFATTDDVYLWLGQVQEAPEDYDTADGQPRTRAHARARLARMGCGDPDTTPDTVVNGIANRAAAIQRQWILTGIHRVLSRFTDPIQSVIVSGSGEFLAWPIADQLRAAGTVQTAQPTATVQTAQPAATVQTAQPAATVQTATPSAGPILSLREQLGGTVSDTACAYAVAVLASEAESEAEAMQPG
jgi:probable H4MPT-linked C1 transfer pathway protein